MFTALDFSYAGQFSSLYDLKIASIGGRNQETVEIGPNYSILEQKVRGRAVPFFLGSEIDSKLSFDMTLVYMPKGGRNDLDRREIERISAWLFKGTYEPLQIFDEEYFGVVYPAMFSNAKRVDLGNVSYAIQVTVNCNAPYGIRPKKVSFEVSSSSFETFINVQSSINTEIPILIKYSRTVSSGVVRWVINEVEEKIYNLQNGEEIIYDSDLGILKSSTAPRFQDFTFQWLTLKPNQKNMIEIYGGQGFYDVFYNIPVIM
jgi:phage-related protein